MWGNVNIPEFVDVLTKVGILLIAFNSNASLCKLNLRL